MKFRGIVVVFLMVLAMQLTSCSDGKNMAPVAHSGQTQSVVLGSVVTLDGSGSTDANGDTLTYAWSFTSIPTGSSAVLSDPTAAKPTFTPDLAGTYVAQLLVSDGKLSSTATVTVTVGVGNVAPVANAGTAQNVTTGTLVTLDGSGSTDANGDMLTYAWSFGSIPTGSSAVLSDPTVAKPTFTPDLAGTYDMQLMVNDGKLSSTATVTVTVGVANVAPVANAGTTQNVTTGTLVTLNGSGSTDANGDTLTYAWSFSSIPTGSSAVLSDPTAAKPTFTPDRAGTYVAQLIVSDGKLSSTATVTVTVGVANVAPVANAGTAQSVTTGTLVTLNGSGSTDANGDTLTYAWSFSSIPAGSTAVLSGATGANPTFTPDLPGNYVVHLIVSDGMLSSTVSSVTIGASEWVSLLNNGSFESGLSGWTTATDLEGSATGTCSYNGVTAPGNETLTGVVGYNATDGTKTALGSVSSSSGGLSIISCVLYQDVAIPPGATTATFSFDMGIKDTPGNNNSNAAAVGIFTTASVPRFSSLPIVGGSSGKVTLSHSADVALTHQTSASFNVSSHAGTTVRFAIINAANITGHEVVGVDNVKFNVYLSY